MNCNKCNIDKDLIEFQKRSDTKSGYRTICKSCDRERYKLWRSVNKEKCKEYKSNYRYIYENSLKEKVYNKNYSIKEDSKLSRLKRHKERYENDNIYRIKRVLKSLIGQSIRCNGYKKESKTVIILGCSIEEFKIYLESKFEYWMSWENYGKYNGELDYGWDIDHKIPSSSAKTEEKILELNHYTNLQPLCSKINRDIKKDKLIF